MTKRPSDDCGFVQNLKPLNVSGKGNTWCKFNLQTRTTSSKRIVGFANEKHDNLNYSSLALLMFLRGESDILDRQ